MCAARAMFDCSLRSRGSRFGAASFLSHSQTKSVSARSFRPGQRRAILAPVESAAVVVARRGKSASAHSSSVRRRAICRRSQRDGEER
jgi:hypothetical protein